MIGIAFGLWPVSCSVLFDSFIHQDHLSSVKGAGKFSISYCICRDFKPLLICSLKKKNWMEVKTFRSVIPCTAGDHPWNHFYSLAFLHALAAGSADHKEQLLVSDYSSAFLWWTVFRFGGFQSKWSISVFLLYKPSKIKNKLRCRMLLWNYLLYLKRKVFLVFCDLIYLLCFFCQR